MTRWVYSFGGGHNEGRADMENLLGGKGANLAEMASIGLAATSGLGVVTCDFTTSYAHPNADPAKREVEKRDLSALIKNVVGFRCIEAGRALKASFSLSACVYMLGMMDTVLNLGLNDRTVEGLLLAVHDPYFAWHSGCRLRDIPAEWGTAFNVQAIVFGNMGDDCTTRVCLTCDPSTQENTVYGQYLVNVQGNHVVAGIHAPEPMGNAGAKPSEPSLEEVTSEASTEQIQMRITLEGHYRDMQGSSLPSSPRQGG